MGGKEKHNHHQRHPDTKRRERRGGRDLNAMQPGIVHNIEVNPNGSVSMRATYLYPSSYRADSGRIKQS